MADEISFYWEGGQSNVIANVWREASPSWTHVCTDVAMDDTGHAGIYTGDCSDIQVGDHVIITHSGIWLAGWVHGEVRVTTGEGSVGTAPITLTEAKKHLRVDHANDDDYIGSLMLAVTSLCEKLQRRVYVSRQLTYYLDEFADEIRPPYSPLASVASIKYIDTDGVLQTLANTVYAVDTWHEPGRITLAYGQTWPSIRPVANAVLVTYNAGWADQQSVPDDYKHLVKLLLAHYYENRESVSEVNLREVPQAFKTLLWAGKVAVCV